MGRLTKGELKTAIRTLERNRARSLLTMLGIVIAVASVVAIVGIGQGVAAQISDQTERLGKDLITIRPGQVTGSTTSSLFGLGASPGVGSLGTNDITTITATAGVGEVVPLSLVGGGVTVDQNNHHYDLPVVGTTTNFPIMLNQNIAFGSFFDDSGDAVNKVILGSHVANALFDQNVPLGQTLTILGQTFIVSGILSESQTTPLSLELDFNNAVFISLPAAQQLTNNNAHLYEVLARPVHADQADAVASRLTGRLLAAHGGQEDFTVLKQGQTISVTNAILRLLTLLIIFVGIISLLVGGVGIMNVMLVSVTERMHEIGIRKAVGATNQQILRQFVVEAAVLSIAGALLGVVAAFLLEAVLLIFTDVTPVFSWQAAVIACVVSVAVGMIFGSIPALKAARKDPISALRNE